GCGIVCRQAGGASGAVAKTKNLLRVIRYRSLRDENRLSKKSKIEQLAKSRESRFLVASAAASLSRTPTKLSGRLPVIRRGPSRRRACDAPAALKNFFTRQKNLFRQYRPL